MAEIIKQELTSMDIKEAQLLKLKELFPEAFTEGLKVDWDKLRLSLGDDTVDTGKERYGMNWPGKADCFKTIQQPSVAALVPAREESIDFDTTQNLFIEGDNLEVLKLLQKSYLGKIKIISIDPPYNTGNDFIYPDNYSENLDTYLEYTGQIDGQGRKFATNTETDGRFHSKWMNMMYPRLFLAKNLLKEDGLIFISIDDNEVQNLRFLCNEIFGEENLLQQIIWKNKTGGGAKTKGWIELHEYILCYAKDITQIVDVNIKYSEKTTSMYNKKDEHFEKRGPYATWPLDTTSMGDRPNLKFPIIYNGIEIWPEKQWLWSKERVLEAQAANMLLFNKQSDGSYKVRFKGYLKDENGIIRRGKPLSILEGPYTQEGSKDFQEYLPKTIFPFPKPVNLLTELFSIKTSDSNEDENAIILDFFAGSCSTAEAIFKINREGKNNKKFILVQLPEPCLEDSDAFKEGYKNIADIGKKRIKMVIEKIKKEQIEEVKLLQDKKTKAAQEVLLFSEPVVEYNNNADKDLGFKVFKLQKSNFKIWDATLEKEPEIIQQKLFEHIQHISPEAQQEAILYELLLKSGFELTTHIEALTLAGKTVFSIADGQLLICLEKEITHDCIKAMAEKEPSRVICLDEAFTGTNADALKTNAVQIMKSKGVVNFRTV